MADRLVPAERRAFSEALLSADADDPTLCEGWTAADLAAHVVIRERRPDADLSLLVRIRPLQRWTDRIRERTRDRVPFPELARKVGTPSWPLRLFPLLDEAVNLVELVVHHEDVRRGRPGWEPRSLEPALDRALWSRLRRLAPFSFRRDRRLRVRLETPDGRATTIHAGADGPSVTLAGEPSELLLYVFGRRSAARVSVDGDPEALTRLRALELRA